MRKLWGSGKGFVASAGWAETVAASLLTAALFMLQPCPIAAASSADTVNEIATLRVAAEAGQPGAQFWLAQALDARGDAANAALWYRRAADQGNSEAALRLARLLDQADRIAGNPVEARLLYQQAAEAGLPAGQFNLALMLEEGRGGDVDLEAALRWYQTAALLGHGRAANNLATMLAKGEGVEADRETAATWYRIAARRGVADAFYNLGVLCLTGPHRDIAAAQAWLRLAATQSDAAVAALAQAGLKLLARAMTPELMQQANVLESEFRQSL